MSAVYPQSVCARVREQVSLELDGELSQLEQRMLGAHLERCGACATYAADVRDAFALAALGLGTQLAGSPTRENTLARYAGHPDLSPPISVFEREQAILRVVKVGRGLPPAGSVL